MVMENEGTIEFDGEILAEHACLVPAGTVRIVPRLASGRVLSGLLETASLD